MAADSVELTVLNQSTAQIVLPDSYVGGSTSTGRTVSSSDYDLNTTYDSTTSPAPSNVMAYALTLTGGTDTIDLTAAKITGAESGGVPAATEDLTGDKVFHVEFECPTANTGDITIVAGAANPYNLLGAAFSIILEPGSKLGYTVTNSGLPAIAAGAKTIDVSGTASDILNIKMAFETP